MNVAVVGCGYVGATVSACLASFGHRVVGIDVDAGRAARLEAGEPVLAEPGLAELCRRQVLAGKLRFATDASDGVPQARVVFICVGTPASGSGAPDLGQLSAAAATIAPLLATDAIVVTKSTVPVGSGDWLRTELEEARGPAPWHGSIVANPEFLREGSAIDDFLHPDRIVLGGDRAAIDVVATLFEPLLSRGGGSPVPLFRMDRTSAELVKYAANAALATKISFANEIASLCEVTGGDARAVLPAVGADPRIGESFLEPGLGWGGSCLPKDTAALVATGQEYGVPTPMLDAARTVNGRRIDAVITALRGSLRTLRGRRIAVLGLTFKPSTDDVRDSPAIELVRALAHAGARVRAFDPSVPSAPDDGDRRRARVVDSVAAAVDRADAAVVATAWPEFRDLDLAAARRAMRGDVLVDARGAIDVDRARVAGFRVFGIGWASAAPGEPRAGAAPAEPRPAGVAREVA